jgi:hypothetical protein
MDDGVLGPQTPHSLNGLLGMLNDFSEEPPDLMATGGSTVTSASDCPLLYQHCKECKEPCVAKDRGQGLHLYCLKHKEARQEVWRRVSGSLRPSIITAASSTILHFYFQSSLWSCQISHLYPAEGINQLVAASDALSPQLVVLFGRLPNATGRRSAWRC